ncbi:peptidoglycan DD-metalloendopeptidase family protein [Dictyobacter halimunensis]
MLCLFTILMNLPWLVGMQRNGGWMGEKASAASLQYQYRMPFMHRPYYGYRTIMQRTVSFVDHDKPWYANDGVFVRFDGVSWRTSVYDCIARLSCYDGHNGYDMDMRFEPVLSAAGGRVIRAGWYNAVNHNSSFGLWVAIDHGNGIVTSYGHLSSVLVSDGDEIGTQWQIGTSGTTGASTGPHLHMSSYYLPNWQATDPFGWRGRVHNPNIVRDNYLWVDAPASRTAVPYLGGSHAHSGAILVDDSSSGWSSTGNWHRSAFWTDFRGSLHWTSTGGASATATWRPVIPADGYYEVGVYVDDTHATSSWVPYTIHSANPENPLLPVRHTVRVDESHIGVFGGPFGSVSTGTQWVSLGTYYFHRGTTGSVVLSNFTGEFGTQVAADGVEFVPVRGGYTTPSGGAYIGGNLDAQP